VEDSKEDPMSTCWVEENFPALLHFAYKHAENPEAAILANANAGGECVARGSLLGPLLGAAHGMQGFPQWAKDGLKAKTEIENEI